MSLARQLDDLFFGFTPSKKENTNNTNKNSSIYDDDDSSEDEAYLAEIRRQEEIEQRLIEERGFTRLELETCTKVPSDYLIILELICNLTIKRF